MCLRQFGQGIRKVAGIGIIIAIGRPLHARRVFHVLLRIILLHHPHSLRLIVLIRFSFPYFRTPGKLRAPGWFC